MHWSSFSEFIAMGGYALYVWGSFFSCALLIVMEIFFLKIKNKKTMDLLYENGVEDE